MSNYNDYKREQDRIFDLAEDEIVFRQAGVGERHKLLVEKLVNALRGPLRRALDLKTESDMRNWAIDHLKETGSLPPDYVDHS
jgi:hypothetical protein